MMINGRKRWQSQLPKQARENRPTLEQGHHPEEANATDKKKGCVARKKLICYTQGKEEKRTPHD